MTPFELSLVVVAEIGVTVLVIRSIYESVKKAGAERSWNKFDIMCFALVYILIGAGTSLGITILYAFHAYN